jgi:hypothetical protein
MYYKLVAGEDIFELNPGLRAVPKFKELTDMQMKYICLMLDPSHDNPVRTLIGKQRREKSAILAGYKMEPDNKRLNKSGRDVVDGNVKSINEGIEEFKKLHYDEKREIVESFSNQIAEIRDFLNSDKEGDPKAIKQGLELGNSLPELLESKKKAEEILNVTVTQKPELGETFTVADLPDEDNQELSLLDQVMQNKMNK